MSLGLDLSIFLLTVIGLTARLSPASARCRASSTLAFRLRPEQNFATLPGVRTMRVTVKLLPAIAVLLIGAIPHAQAELGPCKPDRFGGLTCGSGVGAARVIEDTVSPDKRFAFAWRDPDAVPDTMPEGFTDMEFLLVRLSDGAVLAKDQTEYWDTGEGHANRRQERAVWSPDGALAVRIYDTRFETSALQVYAPEPNDHRAAMLDLKKIVEPKVLARMKAKPDTWTFSVSGDATATLSFAGMLRMPLMMWKPKDGPMRYFDVGVRIARGEAGLSARVTSVRETKE